ncbi:MAG: bifunctional phosphopantothenoylcysteine decarboxylase/phosphopantothenate--cysteine ligase CoaBC [candidate division NC10 bacterium]|nr:bifunctional phosphopantothenoylcysteine decarboxylase/phosphopantothenate--cysteine ligase CoaBC [candidate division NC10 bacterium]
MLEGKRILLGVSGSIAAYKAVELLRELIRRGAEVRCAMTGGAGRFVAPLTFQTLSRKPVLTDLYAQEEGGQIAHIAAAEGADLLVVAPATANTLARFAHGLADDFLTNLYLATRCPVLVAPAMDAEMWRHAATQANVATLRQRGVHFVGPASGELASGLTGPGRLAEPAEIAAAVEAILGRARDLAGRYLLMTAGPTYEPLDPVRFVGNRSSGRMGFALAEAAAARGARVTLVSGPTHLAPPAGVECVRVETTQEMYEAVLARAAEADAVIKAAAPADYRPSTVAPAKIKKGREVLSMELTPTPDILGELGRRKGAAVLVGFAAETEDLVANAREKLRKKNLDLVVANEVGAQGAGFGTDTNRVTLIGADGDAESLPLLSKQEVAHRVLDRVARLLAARPARP